MRSLAIDYRDDGIRANAVLPSVIDTAANREQMPKADHSKWVPPVQIARVIRFLCSPDSAPDLGRRDPGLRPRGVNQNGKFAANCRRC